MMVKRDIRLATLADLALMHEWVNADDSLKWKKDTKHKISKEEHAEWFQSRLADPVTQIWIILDDDAPSGQVRLEKKGDLVYAVIIRTKNFLLRKNGLKIKFFTNSVVLLNKQFLPLGSRIFTSLPEIP